MPEPPPWVKLGGGGGSPGGGGGGVLGRKRGISWQLTGQYGCGIDQNINAGVASSNLGIGMITSK